MVKNLPAMQETQVWSLGWEDSLEKRMATHSNILAWRIPWTVDSVYSLAGYSPWGHKELDTAEWISLTVTQVSGEHDLNIYCTTMEVCGLGKLD